jgi:hypothetical protein
LYRNYNFAKAEVHGLVCFSSISLLSPREIQLWGCWDVG